MKTNQNIEQVAYVFQGGGALGAYQAGAYEALQEGGYRPDWLAGISIGAINAAIIAGNPPERRLLQLHAFWDRITSELTFVPWFGNSDIRGLYSEIAAGLVATWGTPGFFRPRLPPPGLWPRPGPENQSYYDTSPLFDTLQGLIDFDYLNGEGPRLSLGAVNIETGNFAYFDSAVMKIEARHIMASGALPPGFPPVEIDGRWYWDGGLVSNTPLQYILENTGIDPLCIFQVDLFNARGPLPENLVDVTQRDKDIRYSSRTRLTTDRFRQLHALSSAARRLKEKLPEKMRNDPDLAALLNAGANCPVTLVHLIHRKEAYEGQSKDFEFSAISMNGHWRAGKRDVERTLEHKSWLDRDRESDDLQIFDIGKSDFQDIGKE